jgi:hypothetical protein
MPRSFIAGSGSTRAPAPSPRAKPASAPSRPNARPRTTAERFQLQKAVGNAAFRQAVIAAAHARLQRVFLEYTGDAVTPQDEELKNVRSVDAAPGEDFEPIPGVKVGSEPVYRRRTAFYERHFATPLERLVPDTVEEQLKATVAFKPGHRRTRSIHPSAASFAVEAPAPSKEKNYDYSKVFAIAQTSPLYAAIQLRDVPVKFAWDESSGEGKTNVTRAPGGEIQAIICSIGQKAFDAAGEDADDAVRTRHALLCALHELHHAYQETHGRARGYEQEFAVRLGDLDRAKRLGLTGAPLQRMATRPLLAYVDLLLARADKVYVETVTGERALDPPATVSAMLTYIPPQARQSGSDQEALLKIGREWLAESRLDLRDSASALDASMFVLAIGCLVAAMQPAELKARIGSTITEIHAKKLQAEIRSKEES